MLKKRLIPVVLVKQGLVVQSIGFRRYLPVGRPKITVEFFNRWDCDEIVLLAIDREPDLARLAGLTAHVSGAAFVPLTVGGGVRRIEDFQELLRAGADKVSLNTAAFRDPELITRAAEAFGNQEVVVSIDARRHADGRYEVFVGGGREATGADPRDFAREAERRGAGEILLNAIDRDGGKQGYDLELVRRVATAVSIPVIALGGVGRIEHVPEAIGAGAAAAAASNIFHHIEHSTILAKQAMHKAGIAVRRGGTSACATPGG